MREVYGYARLSRDEDKKNYGSIDTQINLINEYAEQLKVQVKKIFVDDNVSGYIPIEDRPEFYELYQIVEESKEKPIVLTKDWSRLSRNNAIAQTILNKWKAEQVELILIKEMGAPFNILKDNDDIVGITTWINERYVRETSRKVRDALSDRMKKGIVIQGPRYGYIKGEAGALTINEEVREAVETIFDLYEQGYGMTAIATKLNKEYDFKNPSIVEAERYKAEHKKDIGRNVREYWETDMINKILRDKTYIGTLVTHKKEVQGIHGKKVKIIPEEENYNFKHHHEAIITEEQFNRVQEILKQRKESTSLYKKGKHNYIFGGFVRCGDCGASATGYIKYGKKCYECLNYSKYRRLRCTYHTVTEEYILENFKIFLKAVRAEYKDFLKGLSLDKVKKKSQNNQEKLKVKLDRIKQEYRQMQTQKIKEMTKVKTAEEEEIVEETYSKMLADKLKEITDTTQTLKQLEQQTEKQKVKTIKQAIDYFDEIIKAEEPAKEVLKQVLDKIIIYEGKNLEFKLKVNLDKLI